MNSGRTFLPPFLAALLFLVLLTAGCASKKKTISAGPKPEGPQALLQRMVSQQVQAEWLSARIRLAYSDESQSLRATGNLHLRTDSLIWMNIRKLGFEVARVQITPDSIFVIDRLNNEYLAEDLGYLNRTYQVPVNFSILQSLMLGNPILFSTGGFGLRKAPNGYLLIAPDAEMPGEYLLTRPELLLSEMILQESSTDRQLTVKLEEYEPLSDKQKFSYFRKINFAENLASMLDLELRFSQVEIDQPRQLKFEIPERYTRVR